MSGGDLTLRLDAQSHLIVDAGTDSSLCFGQSKTLNATAFNGNAPYYYEWSDGLPNGANRTNAGTYTVTVTDYNGCTNLDQIQLTQNPQLSLPKCKT
ncbi:MAG: PKD domain-containing protein [Saprospiraceae bacterium]|nr:PKD domain-containing protein [Saprospiraceae bacterium]